ncbi:response regulator [Dactylosporangium sp. NBC_01737]|uniref:response regulator transcription factor n=1 Tax=Dactylosporangium sp. NBC_01737 TaxID=2975959 RepID=UPI002E0EBD7D|nr:response regulator [Dactylosporangium sp. NBC_01737]
MLGVHADIDVIGSVEDGAAAIRTAAQLRPDVVVMDIRMPKTNGIAKTHVSRVLIKLGLRDRVQAVVFAYQHGLVVPGEGP